VDDIDPEHVQHIKDLGITFDVKLNFGLQISDKVTKANSILGIIKKNFKIFISRIFCYVIRSFTFRICNVVLSPYKKCDIHVLEGVQRRAAKLINSIKYLTYENRHQTLQIPTIKYRTASVI